MSTKENSKFLTAIALALIFPLIAVHAMAASAPLTGAIFTTDENSNFVNGNIYEDMADVYLNGGPRPNAPCTAAGLPDGDYYFQVTDPPGKVLLSTDLVMDRQVHAAGGVIKSVVAGHQTGFGKCPSSLSVSLFPYNPTPNEGGEYKVWMTPVGSYSPGHGSFGFVTSSSKTDNFKVVAPECPIGSEGCL